MFDYITSSWSFLLCVLTPLCVSRVFTGRSWVHHISPEPDEESVPTSAGHGNLHGTNIHLPCGTQHGVPDGEHQDMQEVKPYRQISQTFSPKTRPGPVKQVVVSWPLWLYFYTSCSFNMQMRKSVEKRRSVHKPVPGSVSWSLGGRDASGIPKGKTRLSNPHSLNTHVVLFCNV